MPPEVLPASDAGDAEPLQQWAAIGLPVPPTWAIDRDWLLAQSPQALTEALAELRGVSGPDGQEALQGAGSQRYWLLRQGPMNPTSLRESLVNLDSDAALATALRQLFAQQDGPQRVLIQSLPGRVAAGVLFTRHPVRQDLDHMIVEGVAETADARQERIILHRDGRVAYQSEHNSALVEAPGALVFASLAHQLRRAFDHPQACEWIYDGQQLWLVQTLPVGSLPAPREAWSRRAGFAIWPQAVTPLWYTLAGRWLKTGFWRPLGERLGWNELANVEPYRRQHSHIYINSQFFRQLLPLVDCQPLREALPPAWRPGEEPQPVASGGWALDGLRPWLTGLQLGRLERRFSALQARTVDSADQAGVWQHLMQFDRIGEQLAASEGWLAYIAVPRRLAGSERPQPLTALLSEREITAFQALAEAPDLAARKTALAALAPGADPVFARAMEQPAELESLAALEQTRLRRLAEATAEPAEEPLLAWRQRARALREQLGDSIRSILLQMAGQMVARGQLSREDDICFLYFDELWQLWHQAGHPAGASAERLAERKMRYLTSAYQGAPDWMIDKVAYGVRLDQRAHPVLNGVGLVAGEASGPVRRIYSGWALGQIEPGDIVVLDQAAASWLPWLCLAGGLILTGRDPLDPAAAMARAVGIPAVCGVDDAMHCLVDGNQVSIDGSSGRVEEEGRTSDV